MLTCKDTIAVLSDYLDSLCGPDLLAQIEEHLRDCAPCRAYLATFRRTRELAHREGQVEMPPEMKSRLRRFLLQRLQASDD
jgi:predicted anti-sigma-YlaC factor YlaD